MHSEISFSLFPITAEPVQAASETQHSNFSGESARFQICGYSELQVSVHFRKLQATRSVANKSAENAKSRDYLSSGLRSQRVGQRLGRDRAGRISSSHSRG